MSGLSFGNDAKTDVDEGDIVIFEGSFNWCAAWSMMVWILAFIVCMVLMVLSARGSAFEIISEEVSFVKERNPPYGPAEQPNIDSVMREINQPFRYRLPQTALWYSLAASSLGLFTVSYFTSFMLLEDQGTKRVVDIGFLISKGVKTYMERVNLIILFFQLCGSMYVLNTAGSGALMCFLMGGTLNQISARLGVSVAVHGQTRLAHALSHELFDALQIGIRTGAIGGLMATSLGLGGMAGMWLLTKDTLALSGFGSGASIVSFYMRVGGGIFSKGADIGADLVGESDAEHDAEEEMKVFQLQQKMSELHQARKERTKAGQDDDPEELMDALREMESEMQDLASQMLPIDYLENVGENINEISAQCADLFESMVLILSTCTIIGSKGSPVPHFNSALPYWIIATGKMGSSLVAYYCHCHEAFSSRRLRWSLRANLGIVIIMVQIVQVSVSFQEYLGGKIEFQQFWHFFLISLMGQLAPEICVSFGDFFTSVDYTPVKSLAINADLGVVQVVLQGLGQGFMSVGFPAASMIIIVVITWSLEGHYGLALLSASSVSGTGFQGGIASFGAIAINAHKIVHLTTYQSMARHRANVCAALGTSTAHAGNTVSAVNAFSAVFNVALILLAQVYTTQDKNYMQVTGSVLSNYSQAGLVYGTVLTMQFAANTMICCLNTSREFFRFCKESAEVKIKHKLPFPHSHIKPLKVLTRFGTVTSMRMVISPMINAMAVPMIGGFFLGTKGLLFVISGSNVLVLCLSLFLMNTGAAWGAARKLVLFGLLKDTDGNPLGPESHHYHNLGVGEQIGGPFQDTTGPALNNYVKFVAVFAFVTGGPGAMYDETPENTWYLGFFVVLGALTLIFLSQVGLTLLLKLAKKMLERRQQEIAYEEEGITIDETEDVDDFEM